MTIEEKINELQAQVDELKAELNKRKKTFYKGKAYYIISSVGDIATYNYRDDELDQKLINYNNIFDASFSEKGHLKWYTENVIKIQNRLMQLHEELCPDYFPNWDGESTHYRLAFDFNMHKWVYWGSNYNNCFTVYFTVEAASAAVKILNDEKFMMNEKEKYFDYQ